MWNYSRNALSSLWGKTGPLSTAHDTQRHTSPLSNQQIYCLFLIQPWQACVACDQGASPWSSHVLIVLSHSNQRSRETANASHPTLEESRRSQLLAPVSYYKVDFTCQWDDSSFPGLETRLAYRLHIISVEVCCCLTTSKMPKHSSSIIQYYMSQTSQVLTDSSSWLGLGQYLGWFSICHVTIA